MMLNSYQTNSWMQYMLTNKRILITGGAGFVGSLLAERLSMKNQDSLWLGHESKPKKSLPSTTYVFLTFGCTSVAVFISVFIQNTFKEQALWWRHNQ